MAGEAVSKRISVIFVLEDGIDESNISRDMQASHQCCMDQEVSTARLSDEECLKLNPKKTDIFVFEKFQGSSFAFLKQFKCVIISPRCLMTCLVERKPIPNIPSPIFTIAMLGIIVTASGFTKDQKKILNERIGLMGGIYLNAFNASVTHLVANAVGSQKYKVAAERGIPVMTEDWVNAVWEAGLKENVSALDPQFSHHKLPVFKGMLICASQISKKEKQNLMKTITSNGGHYSAQLECKETGLLVLGEPSGAKYTYAKKWGIPCVSPQWVFDSATKSYSLPFDDYIVDMETRDQAKCSTPKMGDNLDALPDFSMCSTIVGESSRLNINETRSDFSMTMQNTPKKGNGSSKDYINLVNKLDVSEAKKAGSFLDGCKIYLSGFSPSQVEKLRKIINGGGATRFHQMAESVSHVIVGEFVYEEIKTLKSGKYRPFVVRVDWLLESMHLGRVADEEKFLCFELKPLEPPSPLSKKGLQLLQGGSMSGTPAAPRKVNTAESNSEEGGKPETNDRDLLQQYLGGNSGQDKSLEIEVEKQKNLPNDIQPESKDAVSNQVVQREELQEVASDEKLFQGLRFVVAGFNRNEEEDVGEDLQQMLVEYGGQVVQRRFRGIPDYGIVPIVGSQLPCTVGEVVTHLWLEDCHEQERIVPVEYYHRPFSLEPDCKPLSGCVVGISSYVGKERAYISSLAEALGAYSQEVFSKKDIPGKNAVASTHLICPTPEGNKYAAAVKWGLPAVTKEWVLACAQKRQKVPESDFVVGKASEKAISKTFGSTVTPSVIVKESVTETKSSPSDSENVRNNCNVTAERIEVQAESVSAIQMAQSGKEEASRENIDCQQMAKRTPKTSVRMLSFSSAKSSGGSNNDCSLGEKSLVSNFEDTRKKDGFACYNFTPPNSVVGYGDSKTNEYVVRGDGMVKKLEMSGGKEAVCKKANQQLESTPGTPYGQVFEADPSHSTRKAWKNWVENIPRLHQATPPRMAKDPETPFSELKRQLWASIDRVCDRIEAMDEVEAVNNEDNAEKGMATKRKRIDQPKKEMRPFDGVIAYIWKELPKKEREQLSIKVENLGGIVHTSYSDKVTHAVFQGEESECCEEFRSAQEAGKAVVAPAWVELCASEGTRKDEALFPPADYPKNCSRNPGANWESLWSMSCPVAMSQAKRAKSDVSEWLPGMKNGNLEELKESFRKPEVHMQLKKLDHVLAEESQSTPEKSRLPRATSSATREERVITMADSASCHSSNPSTTPSVGHQSLANPPSPGTQGSVSEVILWQENGAVEEETKKETKCQLKLQTVKTEEPATAKQPPKFMFSSMEDVDRARYRELIVSLGGSVSADSNFDIEASHLITLRPARSEKLLGSIASGKWVLHPEYLEVSKCQAKFVEEEPYEWGNPEGVIPLPSVEMERILSEAIHRWRIRIKGISGENNEIQVRRPLGVFEGVCAIVHMAEERAAAFRRLIIAGGGTISEAKPPYSNASDATLCLMELARGQGMVDVESLAKKEIPCLKPLYLNECLTRVNSPDPIEFAIPEYLAALYALRK